MLNRIYRAFMIDKTLFRNLADDPSYTGEAIAIAVLSALIGAFSALWRSPNPAQGMLVSFTVNVLLSWVLVAVIVYLVGTYVFKGRSGIVEMLRVLAYAGVWRFAAIIPCMGWLIALIGGMIATVVAVRELMEFDTTKAVITSVLGWVVYLVVQAILAGTLFG